MPGIFFSIVIPTYNRAGYIGKTVESLLRQDDPAYEIIVVDDGSTDNTEAVLAQIKSDKLSYHKKINAERGAARNYGARLAKGTYVNFFDSDDVAYPNHLSEARKAIVSLNQPEVIHLGYDVKDAEGKLLRTANAFPATINEALIDGNHLSCNAVFVRRDIAAQWPFSENRLLSASEDYALWLKLASRYDIHCWNAVTSTVVNHELRSVLTINLEKFLQRMEILCKELQADNAFVERYGSRWNTFLSYLDIYIALHLAMARYPKRKSIAYLWQAAVLRPQVVLTRRFAAALKKVLV
jgi:glycosyltransferase involved in cell wall biosynthesis